MTRENKPGPDEKLPEELVFDKAIKADKIESLEKITDKIKKLKSISKDSKGKDEINSRIKTLEELKEKLNLHIADEKKRLDEEK